MSYFAHLPGVTAAAFNAEGSPERARYMAIVLAKSRSYQAQAGVPKDPAVVIVSATPQGGSLSVYTRVYFPPGQNVAAQGMWSNLLVPPGEQAPWLQAAWPGTELTLVKRWVGGWVAVPGGGWLCSSDALGGCQCHLKVLGQQARAALPQRAYSSPHPLNNYSALSAHIM